MSWLLARHKDANWGQKDTLWVKLDQDKNIALDVRVGRISASSSLSKMKQRRAGPKTDALISVKAPSS